MLFMSYRPRAMKNVKAEQVTPDNVSEIAGTFFGMAKVAQDGEGNTVLKIATLDGVLEAQMHDWVVRHEDKIETMSDPDFCAKYERARVTREG